MTKQVIYVQDKWDTYSIDAGETDEEFYKAAWELFCRRLENGFWYDNWDDGNRYHQWKDMAIEIWENEDYIAAWDFLLDRSDHEYEYVEKQFLR